MCWVSPFLVCVSRPCSWGDVELGFISKGNKGKIGLNLKGMNFNLCFCVRMHFIRLGVSPRVSVDTGRTL